MRFPEARNKRQLPIDQFPALATALYWPDQGFYRQANALRTLSSVSAVLLPGDGRRSFSTVPWPIDQLIFSHPASSSACGKWFCTPFSSVEPGVPNSKKHVKRRMAGFHPFFDIPSHPAPAANGFARCLPRQNRRISELKKARKRRMAGFLPFFLIFHRTRRLRQTVLPGAFPGRTENLRIRYKSPARKQLLPRRAFINVFQSARRGAAGPSP